MAINPPVTHTVISTQQWGIPITNQVNTNTTDIAALKPTAWVNLTLVNGWTSTLGVGTQPQYRKLLGDNVQLRGAVSTGARGTVIFTLPVGFRPYQFIYPSVSVYQAGTWAVGALEMNNSNGNVTYHAEGPPNPFYVDIGMIFSTIA